MIRRHSLSAVCMHWFNAFCWIALLFTGFALLSNPAMQPVGMWWADLWTGVFGAYGLLVFHLLIGSAWLAVYFLYIIFGLRHDVVPFLKEVFSLSPASDMIWCVRKGMRLVLGEKAMRSMGLDSALPPQGFYNAGQKLLFWVLLLSMLTLLVTGIVIWRQYFSAWFGIEAIRLSALLHAFAAFVLIASIIVHIYAGIWVKGSMGAMLYGKVSRAWARKHHNGWLKEVGKGEEH